MLDNLTISCDYISVSFKDTFDDRLIIPDCTIPKTRMQYTGYTNEDNSVFFGAGYQQNTTFYLLVISGYQANDFFEQLLLFREYNEQIIGLHQITRLDLKVDIPKIVPLNYADLDRCSKKIITSSDKQFGDLTTLYAGSRESSYMWRIYHKPLNLSTTDNPTNPTANSANPTANSEDTNPKLHTRFELEMKTGDMLAQWYNNMQAVNPQQLYAHYLRKLMLKVNQESELYQTLQELQDAIGIALLKTVPTPTDDLATIKWLFSVVAPSLARVSKQKPFVRSLFDQKVTSLLKTMS